VVTIWEQKLLRLNAAPKKVVREFKLLDLTRALFRPFYDLPIIYVLLAGAADRQPTTTSYPQRGPVSPKMPNADFPTTSCTTIELAG
jgi:hypothetical protein